ncbi:MAG: hypothetical protein ACYCYM_03545, partial [Saccharofermentanales bacterium]
MKTKKLLSLLLCIAMVLSLATYGLTNVFAVDSVDMITSSANDLNQIAGKVGTFLYKERDVATGTLIDLTPDGSASFWSGSAGTWLSNAPHKQTEVQTGKATIIQWEAASYGSISVAQYGDYGPHAQDTQGADPLHQTGYMYIYKNGDIANPIFSSELTGNPISIPANDTLVSAGDVLSVEYRAGTASALPSKFHLELQFS